MSNDTYTLFKGKLKFGVPFRDGYKGNPHYVVVMDDSTGQDFKAVTNVKSDSSQSGSQGYLVLYSWDQYFDHPMLPELSALPMGIHTDGFPTLDYVHDTRLLDLSKMRPIALDLADESSDINDLLNRMLGLDTQASPIEYAYEGSKGVDMRLGLPAAEELTVYAFGLLFPARDGLHETHMNQGNPKIKPTRLLRDHSSENGIHRDGALLVERNGRFQALFTAFQTQLVPTDNWGYPVKDARPILD